MGSRVFALGAIWLGIIGLFTGAFASAWQPVPSTIPLYHALAYLTAVCFVLSGVALFFERTQRVAALVLCAFYALFGIIWLGHLLATPRDINLWESTLEEFALAGPALTIYARSTQNQALAKVGCVFFALGTLLFGIDHFVSLKETMSLVPAWMPGPLFWAVAVGIAHILAALALLTGIFALWAARLEAIAILGFSLLLWIPAIFQHPYDRMTWGANAINLALAGSAWVVADWLRTREVR